MIIGIQFDASEDQEEVFGILIIDRDEGVTWVNVDPSEIDHDAVVAEGTDSTEFWGAISSSKSYDVEVSTMSWCGYKIINADIIAEELYERGYL